MAEHGVGAVVGVHRSFFTSADVVYEKCELDVLSSNYDALYFRLLCDGRGLDGAIDYDGLPRLRETVSPFSISRLSQRRSSVVESSPPPSSEATLMPTRSAPVGDAIVHVQRRQTALATVRRNTLPLSREPVLSLKSKSASEHHIVMGRLIRALGAVSSSSMKDSIQEVSSSSIKDSIQEVSFPNETTQVVSSPNEPTQEVSPSNEPSQTMSSIIEPTQAVLEEESEEDNLDFDMIPEDTEETAFDIIPEDAEETEHLVLPPVQEDAHTGVCDSAESLHSLSLARDTQEDSDSISEHSDVC